MIAICSEDLKTPYGSKASFSSDRRKEIVWTHGEKIQDKIWQQENESYILSCICSIAIMRILAKVCQWHEDLQGLISTLHFIQRGAQQKHQMPSICNNSPDSWKLRLQKCKDIQYCAGFHERFWKQCLLMASVVQASSPIPSFWTYNNWIHHLECVYLQCLIWKQIQ